MSNTTPKRGPTAAQLNTPEQRTRRKFFREVGAFADDMLRAMGFTPAERRAQMAISMRLYEYANEAPDKPRPVALISIGKGLTSRSDDDEACKQAAIRHVGHLFNHAIPRTGYQTHTRYKAEEGSNKAHEYVDHIVPVASFFSELLSEEIKTILADKGLEKSARRAKIEETRASIIVEALGYMPKCEVALVGPDDITYAYVSSPDAKAYCAKNPEYKAQAFQYQEPDPPSKSTKPYCAADFARLRQRAVTQVIDDILNSIGERNGPDTAKAFWANELFPALQHAGDRWMNVYRDDDEEEEEEELYTGDKSNMGTDADDAVLPVENSPEDKTEPGDKLSPGQGVNSFADNADENEPLDNDPVENPPEAPTFYSAFEAANYYARRGFPVLPVCQFDPATGRCTWAKHPATCKTRKPLVWADDKDEGEGGYRAATLDRELVRNWFTGGYRDQGVAIRTDGKIVIDADVKDNAGGLESYQVLVDTFDLAETLTQITHSDGRHFVFDIPEDLPPRYLKSWVRVGKKVGLPGIDLKVDKWGLLFVEPTRGPKGFYRWVNVDAPLATLPRECADFLHDARYKETPEQKAKAAKASARVYTSSGARQFDSDQSKYFVDVPNGERHPRLLTVGNAMWHAGASEAEIVDGMRYHASRFSDPLNDDAWIARTAASIAREVLR